MRVAVFACLLLMMSLVLQASAFGPVGSPNHNRAWLISQLPEWDPSAPAELHTASGVQDLPAHRGLDRIVQRIDSLGVRLGDAQAFALSQAAMGNSSLPLAGDIVMSEVGVDTSCPTPDIVSSNDALDLFLEAPTQSGQWNYESSGHARSDVSLSGDGLAVMFVGGNEQGAAFYNAEVVYGGNAQFMCLSFFNIVLNVPTVYGLIAEAP